MEYKYVGKLCTYTQSVIDEMKKNGHTIAIYPRRKIAVIDGYKKYKIVEAK